VAARRQSVFREELAALGRQLEPAWAASFKLTVRCGVCPNRRRLDELMTTHEPAHDLYYVVSRLPTSMQPGFASETHGTRGATRPSTSRIKGAFGRPEDRVEGHDVWMWGCHPRCGKPGKITTHTLTEQHVIEEFLRAYAEGRTEIVLGIDR
jgi:hypothetical protein